MLCWNDKSIRNEELIFQTWTLERNDLSNGFPRRDHAPAAGIRDNSTDRPPPEQTAHRIAVVNYQPRKD